jgi:hypothetical protein
LGAGFLASAFLAALLLKVVFRAMSIVSLSPKVVVPHLYTRSCVGAQQAAIRRGLPLAPVVLLRFGRIPDGEFNAPPALVPWLYGLAA